MRTAVRGYHVYGEVLVLTIDEEFDCRQEADNREDRYAVAVYGDTQSSTCMYSAWTPFRQISRVSFMLLEYDGTITVEKPEICHN